MTYQAKAFKIFLASPSDMEDERVVAREVIQEWNYMHSEQRGIVLMPIGWETHAFADFGRAPQEVINSQVLDSSDLLVGIFGTRIGTATTSALSGTIEEIEKHAAEGKPAMVYFSNAPIDPKKLNIEQFRAVQDFKNHCKSKSLFFEFESAEDFRKVLSRNLAQRLNNESTEVSPSQPKIISYKPSNELKELLLVMDETKDYQIHRIQADQGVLFLIGNKSWPTEYLDDRSRAEYEDAFNELDRLNLIADAGNGGTRFKLTKEGFRVLDQLLLQTRNEKDIQAE